MDQEKETKRPVSYTHLDVYKRQIEGCILLNGGEDRPILCKVYTGLTMEQEALLFAEQNGHAAPLSAVSYTHRVRQLHRMPEFHDSA